MRGASTTERGGFISRGEKAGFLPPTLGQAFNVWLRLCPRVEVLIGNWIELFRYRINRLCDDLGDYFFRDALPQQPAYTGYELGVRETYHGVMLLHCCSDIVRQISLR